MAIKIHVLPLEGVFDTGLACLLDTLGIANALAESGGMDTRFDVSIVGVAAEIRTGHGLRLPLSSVPRAVPDWVLVPSLAEMTPGPLVERLESADTRMMTAVLRDYAKRGARIGAACTGSFVLAEAGLLDGYEATTSWWLAPLFRQRYPQVRLNDTRMLIETAGCVTAGAAIAHLDLALWLVRQVSPTLAEQTARYLVVDARPSQSSFVIPNHLAHNDPVVQRFEAWARTHLVEGFSLASAAREVGASARTLSRRLQATLGKSPLGYFQDLRVERAVHLLQTSRASVDQVAAAVGYADGVTLRTLLRKKTGHSARTLRAFGAASAPANDESPRLAA